MTERDALIAMNRVTGLGAITAKRMAARFGSLAAVFEASESDLLAVAGIGPDKAHQFWSDLRQMRADAASRRRRGHKRAAGPHRRRRG